MLFSHGERVIVFLNHLIIVNETIDEVALQFLALQSIYLIYFVQIFLSKDKLDAGVP